MAIPYVKQTWADGSGGGTPVSAARLGALETGVFDAHYQPAVHVYHNATQSITNSVETALSFNSERYDQASNAADTMHDTVTNNTRLTCRYAGVYHVTGTCEFAANATGMRFGVFRVNGTAGTYLGLDRLPGHATVQVQLNVATDIALAVNDYVEFVVFQTSGAGLNVSASGASVQYGCEFMMHRVG
jgi:hypothetical protein